MSGFSYLVKKASDTLSQYKQEGGYRGQEDRSLQTISLFGNNYLSSPNIDTLEYQVPNTHTMLQEFSDSFYRGIQSFEKIPQLTNE